MQCSSHLSVLNSGFLAPADEDSLCLPLIPAVGACTLESFSLVARGMSCTAVSLRLVVIPFSLARSTWMITE